jgi:hypothetical protein
MGQGRPTPPDLIGTQLHAEIPKNRDSISSSIASSKVAIELTIRAGEQVSKAKLKRANALRRVVNGDYRTV